MEKFKSTLERTLMPIAMKLGNNKFLLAIRDGMTLSMPLIIIGSLFMIIASLPIESFTAWLGETGIATYLWKGVDSSFGLSALVASFGIANSLASSYKVDGIAAGIVSLSTFVVLTPFVSGETGSGLTIALLGGSGIFVAIILGLVNGYVYQWFINKNIRIKLPEAVPPAISRSFSAVIPGAVMISFWLFVYALLDANGLPNAHGVVQAVLGGPLSALGGSVIGTMIVTGLNSLFWFMGIHGGATVNSLFSPIWLQNLDINRLAQQSGEPLTEIITGPFMDNFVYIGGGGATLGLVIGIALLAIRKNSSQQTKAVAPLTLTPGLFNINEPAMFGLPIVMDVTLLIPFVLVPMVNTLVAYYAFSTGIVPLTYASATWTMPPIISGFLTTGSIMGSLLQIVIIAIDIILYLPFYMMVDDRNRRQEQGIAK